MDIAGAVKRPFTDWKKLLIGAFLYMVPYLNIVTTFFATGYTLVAAKNTIANNKRLPEWSDWPELFIKGALSAVIGLSYMVPVILLFYIFGLGSEVFGLIGGSNPLTVLRGSGPLLIVIIVLAIITAYITPYAVLLYIDMGQLKEAYSIKHVLTNAFTWTYFSAWIVGMIYSILLGIVITFINYFAAFTVVVPLILVGFYRFISGITILTLLGEAFRELK
tara:strand:+ start:11794 stop:12453 length:660 start_codon:yes stop_codon:yes gene_type:complete